MHRNYDKQRRGKYVAPGILSNFQYDGENAKTLDSRRNSRRRNDVIAGNDRNERRISNSAIDHVTSYFSPTDIHAPLLKHGLTSLPRKKYAVPLINDEPSEFDDKNRATTRISKNQLSRLSSRQLIFGDLFGNNDANGLAETRKNRHVDDFDDWIEYNENEDLAEANEDIERCLRLDDEINEKDYEENEVDDEIDEESDARECESSVVRGQRKIRTETLRRGQRISSAGLPPRYHRGQKIDSGKSSERYCHRAVDRKTTEVRTEEDEEDEPEVRENAAFSSKKSAGRARKGEDLWFPPRNAIDNRYSDSIGKSSGLENRQTRRIPARSGAQQESVRNTKCELCGRTSEKMPKTMSSRNATGRLQDSRFFIDDPIDEIFEKPTNCSIYQPKARRSKESRLPSFEPDEKELTIDDRDDDENDDEIGAIYKSSRGKKLRESMNARRVAACQRSARREATVEK